MFWFYVIIHATINEKKQDLMYSLKKIQCGLPPSWVFGLGIFFVSFAFPFFSIIALQGTNKTANVFFTYTVVCFPLIIAKGALVNFVVKRAKSLGLRSKKRELDSAYQSAPEFQLFIKLWEKISPYL